MEESPYNITDDVKVSPEYKFSKYNLSEQLQRGLQDMNFINPSPVQLKVIPLAKSHLDMIIQAKSGTGKTLAFSICLLECYEQNLKFPQALVIVPTREIAVQIVTVLNNVGKYLKYFRACEFIGGMSLDSDRKRIQHCKFVIGTPGRILHLIKNDIFNTTLIKSIVLDEADNLIEAGQKNKDVNSILNCFTTYGIQIIAVTATVTSQLERIMKKVMKNPIGITPKHEAPILLGVKQFALELSMDEKTDNIYVMKNKILELQRIFKKIPFKQCLLFTNSQAKTETYGNYLKKIGWQNEVINGSQDQQKRLDTLKKLIKYKCRILITTDLMARGIDVENINLVINLDLPYEYITYLHRIGRAGRFGSHGIAITFLKDLNEEIIFKKLISKIGLCNVLKYPNDNLNYNFWNFDDEQDMTLEKMSNTSKDESQAAVAGIIEKNLMLFEISKKLVDDDDKKFNILNSFDYNVLLKDYEENKSIKFTCKDKTNVDIESLNVNLCKNFDELNEFVADKSKSCIDPIIISKIVMKEFKQDNFLYHDYNKNILQNSQKWKSIFDFQLAKIQNFLKLNH